MFKELALKYITHRYGRGFKKNAFSPQLTPVDIGRVFSLDDKGKLIVYLPGPPAQGFAPVRFGGETVKRTAEDHEVVQEGGEGSNYAGCEMMLPQAVAGLRSDKVPEEKGVPSLQPVEKISKGLW